ncbi:salivary gland secretion protein 4 [Drepanopeziza brunnea f. sp. 'multigermtubi' MB_m1]|uniref:Salivary gland secretion protein 4 n=1 Tax=Marssonina brunnea f. sp. multigermtubi (strain MB_m1) TaxID=1072389 RepID=K1W6D2_MARBU|nr:salivary gland secretion protein 4 [Drepanopeziza brunnea f. sp. 'multigermtubi' MB_m1]EKD12530.1 salivary gland secretion protein 4 [Drepanopeziza brunnea f. sp. 'multigermtubi' MB_m1]
MQSAECRVQSAECRVQNAECRVQSAECRVQSAECRVQSAECRVQSAECRVQSAECRVQSAVSRVQSAECRLVSSMYIWLVSSMYIWLVSGLYIAIYVYGYGSAYNWYTQIPKTDPSYRIPMSEQVPLGRHHAALRHVAVFVADGEIKWEGLHRMACTDWLAQIDLYRIACTKRPAQNGLHSAFCILHSLDFTLHPRFGPYGVHSSRISEPHPSVAATYTTRSRRSQATAIATIASIATRRLQAPSPALAPLQLRSAMAGIQNCIRFEPPRAAPAPSVPHFRAGTFGSASAGPAPDSTGEFAAMDRASNLSTTYQGWQRIQEMGRDTYILGTALPRSYEVSSWRERQESHAETYLSHHNNTAIAKLAMA